ncbi:MAG: Nudix family hydrolase [Arenimonas sp.]|jgi:8-oxo-dGTP diphosphatase
MPAALPAPVHVVAGVLVDPRGRILLARRTAGRDLAGAWEFPGGKLEPGETPFQALDRELHEELGIRIHSMEPLISVAQAYKDKRIVLDVYRVTRFSGRPRDREKQALAWSPIEKLCTYPMPPADRPVVAALTQPAHYLITPGVVGDQVKFLRRIEQALVSGTRRIQLRISPEGSSDVASLASEVKRLCDLSSAQLLLNSDIELAARLHCGIHLRAAQLMSLGERPLPVGVTVAASCHNEDELRQAEAIGVDFVVLGPVGKTPSHTDQAPIGWKKFVQLREHVSLPIYALGGLRPADHDTARRHGAQGIAAIRGLWPA